MAMVLTATSRFRAVLVRKRRIGDFDLLLKDDRKAGMLEKRPDRTGRFQMGNAGACMVVEQLRDGASSSL